MNYFLRFFLGLGLVCASATAQNLDLRQQIGSVFSAPIFHQNKIYFVATTGVLYEADEKITKVKKLYEGKRQTIGSLILADNKLIWGDGMHSDKKATIHVFDLKTNKHLKDIEVEGHIQRPALHSKGMIYLPLGPGGLLALDAKNLTTKWKTSSMDSKKFHIDSNILEVGDKVCATSVYEFKGVVCFNALTGKPTQIGSLSRDPKSEITLWKDHVVGFATEGDLTRPKWDIPADLYIYDVKNDKIKMSKELRGFNFFAPAISGDEAFVTLSTGDFILVNLNDGKIQFMGEFPEPFTNNAFMRGDSYCGIGIMGKYMCYGKAKTGFALTIDKRLMETVIGKVTYKDGTIAPSRVGYYIE